MRLKLSQHLKDKLNEILNQSSKDLDLVVEVVLINPERSEVEIQVHLYQGKHKMFSFPQVPMDEGSTCRLTKLKFTYDSSIKD